MEAVGSHKLPPNQERAFVAAKVNHALGGICKNAASRAKAVIPALSLALVRPCLGSGSSLGLPRTRQRVTNRPRGATKLELRTWKERLRHGCAAERKRPRVFLLPAAPRWDGAEEVEMEVPSGGTRSSVTSCKKGNLH